MTESTHRHGTERSNEGPARHPSISRRTARLAIRIVAPLLVLATALTAAAYLIETGPQPERKPKPRQARLVEVAEVHLAAHPIIVEAWGQVRPAREVTLRAQVEGKVIEVSPELVPGGRFVTNDIILRIDPADHELGVRQRESQLAKMRSELQVEQGNQVIARREYEILNEELSAREKSLVLRQPQLNAIQADIAAAQAALDEARLALRRTTIEAPFDAVVINRNVDLGTRVTTSTDLVTLVGTEEYWIELAVPVTHLRWIDIPEAPGETGSPVRLYYESVWGSGVYRSGRVIRLLGDLEAEGRMARLLVTVRDPLSLQPEHVGVPRLLLGAFLRSEVQGPTLDNVVAVDRALLRDADQVWVMSDDGRLEIRPVEVAFRGVEQVLIAGGLHEGERLVVSDIAAAAPGMPLRVADDQVPTDREVAQHAY